MYDTERTLGWTLTLEKGTGKPLWVIRDPKKSWVGESLIREDLLLGAENLAKGWEVRAVKLREEADNYQDTADGIRDLLNRTNKEEVTK